MRRTYIEREIRNKKQQNLWPSIDEFVVSVLHTSSQEGWGSPGYIKPGRFVSILSMPAFEFSVISRILCVKLEANFGGSGMREYIADVCTYVYISARASFHGVSILVFGEDIAILGISNFPRWDVTVGGTEMWWSTFDAVAFKTEQKIVLKKASATIPKFVK